MAHERSTSTTSTEASDAAVLWHRAPSGALSDAKSKGGAIGEGGAVVCDLCAHRCTILPGRAGVCKVRVNEAGELRTLVLNRLVAAGADPIEKKPLFHFLPGSHAFSIATAGCNFRCSYCQNWGISQALREGGLVPGEATPPQSVVAAALRSGCKSIAYTYTEPTIFFETAQAVGTLARQAGLKNLFVTNGYMTPECVLLSRAFLDAANVDLKGFRDETYRKVCGATLKGVLEGIDALVGAGIWVEITTLIVPGHNDSEGELNAMAKHIAGLGRHIPWHLSRFHPDYKMRKPERTPLPSLARAYEIGRAAGLDFVYLGNVPGHASENTACPTCGTILIGREGFSLTALELCGGDCPSCGAAIAGVWQ